MPEEKLLKQVTAPRGRSVETTAEGRSGQSEQNHRNDEERRNSTRYAVSAFAEAIETQTNTHLRGRATDLGQGGCYVDAISPFPVGTEVQMRLASGRRTFQSQATVIYSIPGMGMGLAFSEMAPDQATILRTWVGELSGELEPQEVGETALRAELQTSAKPEDVSGLGVVVGELVGLLTRKRLLTESEASELRKKLS